MHSSSRKEHNRKEKCFLSWERETMQSPSCDYENKSLSTISDEQFMRKIQLKTKMLFLMDDKIQKEQDERYYCYRKENNKSRIWKWFNWNGEKLNENTWCIAWLHSSVKPLKRVHMSESCCKCIIYNSMRAHFTEI